MRLRMSSAFNCEWLLSKRIIALIVTATCAFLFASFAHAIDAAPEFSDPAMQARYQHLIGELRCLVCQNETIADSSVQLAGDLRREVRGLVAAGKSDDEIIKFLTDRYGDFVLYNPPFVARTWVLWLAPLFALLLGGIVIVTIIRRRTSLSLDIDGDASDSIEAKVK